MRPLLIRYLSDCDGATAIEYGLIAALVAVAIIAGATTLGGSLNNTFSALAGRVNNAGQ